MVRDILLLLLSFARTTCVRPRRRLPRGDYCVRDTNSIRNERNRRMCHLHNNVRKAVMNTSDVHSVMKHWARYETCFIILYTWIHYPPTTLSGRSDFSRIYTHPDNNNNHHFFFFPSVCVCVCIKISLKRKNNDIGRILLYFVLFNSLFFNFLKSFLMAFGKWGVKKKKYISSPSNEQQLIVFHYVIFLRHICGRDEWNRYCRWVNILCHKSYVCP